MNIIKELWDRSLPNFGYVINMDDGRPCVVVLGGQTIKKKEKLGQYRTEKSARYRQV